MILNKWDYEKHKYENYVVPDNWKVGCSCDSLGEIIQCVKCGRYEKYGDTYTSLEVHTPVFGFGYCVCEKCYNEEWERRKKYRDE